MGTTEEPYYLELSPEKQGMNSVEMFREYGKPEDVEFVNNLLEKLNAEDQSLLSSVSIIFRDGFWVALYAQLEGIVLPEEFTLDGLHQFYNNTYAARHPRRNMSAVFDVAFDFITKSDYAEDFAHMVSVFLNASKAWAEANPDGYHKVSADAGNRYALAQLLKLLQWE